MLARMFLRLLLSSVALVALACGGCAGSAKGTGLPPMGSSGSSRAGATPAARPITLELELLSDSPLRLGFNEKASLSARLSNADGSPVAGGRVSFALMGRSQDSSLAVLDAVTDDAGVAESTLLAGQLVATFRVRISADGALDSFVDVAVSNAGFGTLAVTAAYAGQRAVVQRVVFAQAGMSCKQAERMPGDPTATLASTGDVARFLALPAEVSYAVTALAEAMDGTVLATGCVDGVTVRASAEVTTRVDFKDEPLILSGQFELKAELDSSAPAAVLSGKLRSATEMLVQSDAQGQPAPIDAEGRFLLDSLDGTLRRDPYVQQTDLVALADALSKARMAPASAGSLEHSLQALLAVNSEGPLSAITRIVDLTTKSLATMNVFAELTLNRKDAAHPATWRALRIEALPMTSGASPPAIDLSALQDMTDTKARFVADKDTLELSAVRFRGQLGALATQVLTKVLSPDAGGHGEEIRALVGCATLDEWLQKQSFTDKAACDTSCVKAACERALVRLTGTAQTAWAALDDERPTLTLQGAFELSDDDGDLIPDQMSGDAFLGQWDPAPANSTGDAVSGPASATAVASP
jgi:hypothetical protein